MLPRPLRRWLAVAALAAPSACGLNPQPDLPFGGKESNDSAHEPGSPNIGGATANDPDAMGPSGGGVAGSSPVPTGGSASAGTFPGGGTAPSEAEGGGAGEAPNASGGDNAGGAGPDAAAGADFGGAAP
jgi:hypothetical protein